ncbi:MAG: ABC transporter ATP-binding protein [Alphaproteobacteria bacterium]|nr:ABC transporter ATP-binding protein [Alphaproteobacteria bacterium]
MAALQVRGVRKAFDRQPVLQGVDLAVDAGRLVAILGRSGSGKTTLLRLICGFERVDAGEIAIEGQCVSTPTLRLPPEQRRIGYVAQEGALFPHLAVADNVLFGLPRAARRERHRAEALLEMVGLPPAYAARWPHELSGGEQQRVALARALAPAPRLVLLDEPFSSLDAALRVETREAVAAALRQAGATALLVTHDQAEALSLGQEVAVLRAGRVVQMASPEVLYRQPADAELARFVGEAVLLPGVADGGQVHCVLGMLPLASAVPDGPVEVMLRPEQLVPSQPRRLPQAAATVRAVTFYGPDARVRLALSDAGTVLELIARVPGHMAPAPGEPVGVGVTGAVVAFARPSAGASIAPFASPRRAGAARWT